MFIPEALPALDKIIYIDCDIIVNLDINELWSIDLENKSIAGVLDRVHSQKFLSELSLHVEFLGCNRTQYINSGVTVMNLKKIRERGDFSKIILEWLMYYRHMPLFPDQDAINSVFESDKKFIDPRFNVYDLLNKDLDLSHCIMHMYAVPKPWKVFTGAAHEKLYWNTFLAAEWGRDITHSELIDILADKTTANIDLLTERLNKPLLQRIFASFKYRVINKIPVLNLIKYTWFWIRHKFSH